ncbi:hypothetical protein GCM10011519_29550 [Marmoricola endophyticus]|uniref:SnoaL-like domain-containing protein n=1 Tax=Marmoricola endophyticus TaxID=2040280 RepID=A0A917BP42_9ACTN|nr:nuclear transport factor 2 family protein [Marmoricola endophyticus]GGF53732.1 hypothetical protein GCM10011519_29550 [Marmoricola endophyticus]
MSAQRPTAVAAWHEVVDARADAGRVRDLLAGLLADDVVFRSPAVFAPQEGREAATAYLTAAMAVLGPTLSYRRELYAEDSAVLEFEADLDGTLVHGIDFLRWDGEDRLVDFTVMVRPKRALDVLIEQMAAQLFG